MVMRPLDTVYGTAYNRPHEQTTGNGHSRSRKRGGETHPRRARGCAWPQDFAVAAQPGTVGGDRQLHRTAEERGCAVKALLLLLLAGCGRVVYPGNGHLILVEFDTDLDLCPITVGRDVPTTAGVLFRTGLRYWDAAGVRLRTEDQLLPSEYTEMANAPKLRVRGDTCKSAETKIAERTKNTLAQYNDEKGDIQIFLRYWPITRLTPLGVEWFSSFMAHEAGHAIGLDHVAETNAIMNAVVGLRSDLSDADLQEHARVWP